MDDVLAPLSHWLDGLALNLTAPQRRKLMRSITVQLRISHRKRLKSNIDPEDNAYVPRKRQQIKAIRRGLMFKRLGQFLQIDSSADHAAIGFTGQLGQKMKTHQFGLIQKPTIKAKAYHYPRRELLGFSPEDIVMIDNLISDFFIQNATQNH